MLISVSIEKEYRHEVQDLNLNIVKLYKSNNDNSNQFACMGSEVRQIALLSDGKFYYKNDGKVWLGLNDSGYYDNCGGYPDYLVYNEKKDTFTEISEEECGYETYYKRVL